MTAMTAEGCLKIAAEWEITASKLLDGNPEKRQALKLVEKWLERGAKLEVKA